MKSGHKVGKLTGRPSGKDEGKIKEELQEYFDDGRSILYTVEQTKHNRKTVAKYWSEFRNTYIEQIDENFVARQRAARDTALKHMDDAIDKADTEVDVIKDILDQEPGDLKIHTIYIKALEHQNFLIRKRAAMDMVPTVDVNIDKIIAEETVGQSGTRTDKRKD